MSRDDHPILDPEVLAGLEQLGIEADNPTFLPQLVELFGKNAPVRMEKIAGAIGERDGAQLESVAHTLKSNCAMLGATRMAGYCRDLEAMGERQAFDEAAALLPDAREEFARVARAVHTLGQSLTPGRPE